MSFLNVAGLGIAHRRMLARAVADVPPSQRSARNGADAGNEEREPPRAKSGDQPRNHDCSQRRAERRTAIEQGGAAGALVRRHPHCIEFAAGRIDWCLGQSQT